MTIEERATQTNNMISYAKYHVRQEIILEHYRQFFTEIKKRCVEEMRQQFANYLSGNENETIASMCGKIERAILNMKVE